MQLEDYFEFLDPDDIRIKGHRIGIDDVIKYYLDGYSPDQILENYRVEFRENLRDANLLSAKSEADGCLYVAAGEVAGRTLSGMVG